MIPRWHILLGALFTFLLYFAAPETKLIYLALVFLSSFLIDFDHYVVSVIKTGKASFLHAIDYHHKAFEIEMAEKAKGIKRKGDFHLLHTIEFHVLLGVLAIFFTPMFYVFLGFVFHTLTDISYAMIVGRFYRREYFLFNWLRKKF